MKRTGTHPNNLPSKRKWIQRLDQIIREQMTSGDLSNDQLAVYTQTSKRQLFRRIKALTGLTPQQYIRQQRLQQAMRYLQDGIFRTVKETGQAVGYPNTSHFIRLFTQAFAKRPLDVLREWGWR